MSDQEIKITVIVPARNESDFLGNTLVALKKQSLPPSRIIVVDDGSTDNTFDIAKKFNVDAISLADRGYRATGEPVLADVINKGLEGISKNECKYIVILGADHVLSDDDYISKIIEIMERDDKIVIASGIIVGESQKDTSPRGSGRIVRYDFWKELGLKYPSWYGFESYIVYKAFVEHYKVKVVCNATSYTQRSTGKTTDYKNYGKAMRALGYHPLYAIGRIILSLRHSPRSTAQMLLGYSDSSVQKYDIASKVKKFQAAEIKKKLMSIIKTK